MGQAGGHKKFIGRSGSLACHMHGHRVIGRSESLKGHGHSNVMVIGMSGSLKCPGHLVIERSGSLEYHGTCRVTEELGS